jgi:uncharacterized membrane protein YvbJ
MNQCTRCGGDVPEIAQACMHCGAVFTNTPQYIAQEKANKEAEVQGAGYTVAIMFVIIVIGVFLWAIGWEPYGD